jgi:hypothetical protein
VRLAAPSFALAALLASTLHAASPALSRLNPPAAQKGTETEITLEGARLSDAREILFYDSSITVTKLTPVDDTHVKATFKIPDTALGEHTLRLRTATGISELRTFNVGPYPVVQEKEPNSDFKQPQPIPLNNTIAGVIENEDIDYFSVQLKKGQRITAEVEGIRLGMTLFDPYVAIMDMNRFELAASDDSSLGLQDPVVSLIAPKDGTYIIQLREAAYGGDNKCVYRLHVGAFPRPKTVYPLGGMVGQELALKFLGDISGPIPLSLKLPSAPDPKYHLYAQQTNLISPTPNFIRISPFPNIMEVEPNNDDKTATPANQELPLAFNGIIQEPGDYDTFKFKAKKGQNLDIGVYARRLRSPLDSVLTVSDSKGKQLAQNDDSAGPDSYARVAIPDDGDYFVRIRDHLRGGSPDHTYRIEITPAIPVLTLSIPQQQQNSQERQALAIPRGNRMATVIRATRSNFSGDVVVNAENLPDGVKAECEPMASNAEVVPVVFEAAADAPIAGKLSVFTAKTDGKTEVKGQFDQTVDLVYGGNNTPYYQVHVDKLALVVAEEAPFKLTLIEPKVPLVQNGSMELRVKAERKAGFTGPIAIRMLFNPPGTTAGTTGTIPANKDEATLPISASGGAAVKAWKVAVLGSSDIKGAVWVCSQLSKLQIAEPYLAAKFDMTAIEQGKSGKITCKLDQKLKFDGKAKVELRGLPAGVTATTPTQEITASDDKVTFDVATTAKSPPGQHKNLLCVVTIMKDGEPIIQNVGQGGILRIDRVAQPKDAKDAKSPVATKTKEGGK